MIPATTQKLLDMPNCAATVPQFSYCEKMNSHFALSAERQRKIYEQIITKEGSNMNGDTMI